MMNTENLQILLETAVLAFDDYLSELNTHNRYAIQELRDQRDAREAPRQEGVCSSIPGDIASPPYEVERALLAGTMLHPTPPPIPRTAEDLRLMGVDLANMGEISSTPENHVNGNPRCDKDEAHIVSEDAKKMLDALRTLKAPGKVELLTPAPEDPLDCLIMRAQLGDEEVEKRKQIADLLSMNTAVLSSLMDTIDIPLEVITKTSKGKEVSHVQADVSEWLRPVDTSQVTYVNGKIVACKGIVPKRAVRNAEVLYRLVECTALIDCDTVPEARIKNGGFTGDDASCLASMLNCRNSSRTDQLKISCINRLTYLRTQRLVHGANLTYRSHQRTMDNGGLVGR